MINDLGISVTTKRDGRGVEGTITTGQIEYRFVNDPDLRIYRGDDTNPLSRDDDAYHCVDWLAREATQLSADIDGQSYSFKVAGEYPHRRLKRASAEAAEV